MTRYAAEPDAESLAVMALSTDWHDVGYHYPYGRRLGPVRVNLAGLRPDWVAGCVWVDSEWAPMGTKHTAMGLVARMVAGQVRWYTRRLATWRVVDR